LGTIHNFNPQTGYLDIRQGWLFHKDFFVGTAAVASIDDDGLSFVLTKQDLDDTRFASPPGAGGVVCGDSFAVVEKKPLDVTNEEVPVSGASGMPVYLEDSNVASTFQ